MAVLLSSTLLPANKFKPVLLLAVLLNVQLLASAQDYFNGKMVDEKGKQTAILFDRTQTDITSNVFQTVYKVFSTDNKPVYTVAITHDRQKAVFFIAATKEGAGVKGLTIRYNDEVCGLIFNDINNLDTACNVEGPYRYIISFTDAGREYPILHKIYIGGEQLLLDPITHIRLKKHAELVSHIPEGVRNSEIDNNALPGQDVSEDNFFGVKGKGDPGSFSIKILRAREELYKKNEFFNDSVNSIRAEIKQDLDAHIKTKKIKAAEKIYEGERNRGNAEGKGIMATQTDIYDGSFNAGKFTNGFVSFETEAYQYYGGYTGNTFNGVGWLRYDKDNYLLGNFVKGVMTDGISSSNNSGEVYFGNFSNSGRNGYGELRSTSGEAFYGFFVNGKLLNGYSREVDQFGYATFSKIEDGVKTTIKPEEAKGFFETVLGYKN